MVKKKFFGKKRVPLDRSKIRLPQVKKFPVQRKKFSLAPRRSGILFEGRRDLTSDIVMPAPRVSDENFQISERMFVKGDLLPKGRRKDPVP